VAEASVKEQANERSVRVNERAEERMAQYSTRRFHSHSTHSERMQLNEYTEKYIKVISFYTRFELLNIRR